MVFSSLMTFSSTPLRIKKRRLALTTICSLGRSECRNEQTKAPRSSIFRSGQFDLRSAAELSEDPADAAWSHFR